MALYLSHESAVRYWLTKSGDEATPEVANVQTLALAVAGRAEVMGTVLPLDYSEGQPLHLLVADQASIRNWPGVTCHMWSTPLPPGAFCEFYDNVFVSSPEFTFLQMAAANSLWEAVELGCYLCGCFSISDKGRGYVGSRAPLATPESIATFLDAAKGAHGVNKARRALKYVRPRAASPMEVALVMMFTLPPKEGGWGMPKIEVNQKIEVAPELRPLAGCDHYLGDIYFPTANADVEYDSAEFHTGRYRLDHTQQRRNVLEVMGTKTMSATWGQMSSFQKWSAFVWAVKKRFGIRQRRFSPAAEIAQANLYDFLVNPKRTLF